MSHDHRAPSVASDGTHSSNDQILRKVERLRAIIVREAKKGARQIGLPQHQAFIPTHYAVLDLLMIDGMPLDRAAEVLRAHLGAIEATAAGSLEHYIANYRKDAGRG
ncbi:hypothetical protein EIK56_23075 [Sphingomonas sp. C8-2]|nr:hypothetical protein EIK56_23075 [Sphingomonas sp. C8-2]